MHLVKVESMGLNDIYAVSVFQKEFRKAVDEPWEDDPPWKRYQNKLMQDLAVLDMDKEAAIDLAQYERLSRQARLYSIRHPESKKNLRILYTITEESIVILLVAFLEKNGGDYQKAIKLANKRLKILEDD